MRDVAQTPHQLRIEIDLSRTAPHGTTLSRSVALITRLKTGWLGSLWTQKALNVAVVVLLCLDVAVVIRSILRDAGWMRSTDLGDYVTAAADISRGANPWDYTLAPVTSFGAIDVHMPYFYPPAFAEVLWPLMALGPGATRWGWTIVVYGCLLGGLALLLRGFGTRTPWPMVGLIAAITCATGPIRDDLFHGQANLVLLFLIVLALWLYSRERLILAGLVLGSSFVIKPFLGVLVLYLLWKRSWTMAIAAVITSALLLVASFVPLSGLGTGAVFDWLNVMRYAASPTFAGSPFNVSMQGLFLRLFTDNPFTVAWIDNPAIAQGLAIALYVSVALVFVRCIARDVLPPGARRTAEGKALLLAEVGVFLSLAFAASPLTEEGHLMFLLPGFFGVVVLAIRRLQTDEMLGRTWLAVLGSWGFLFVLRIIPLRLPGVPFWTQWTRIDGPLIVAIGLQGFVLLFAALSLAALLRRQRDWRTSSR